MFQEESIYNLLPAKNILPSKERIYHSKYPAWIAPTASTFILQNTSYPGVANTGGSLRYPRGAHPIYGNWRSMGLPRGGYKINPEKFYKKNHQYKILPPPVEKIKLDNEIKKPAIVTVKEKPIMGLKSQKNYVTSNAIDNILMEPRKRKIPNDENKENNENEEYYKLYNNKLNKNSKFQRATNKKQTTVIKDYPIPTGELKRKNKNFELIDKKNNLIYNYLYSVTFSGKYNLDAIYNGIPISPVSIKGSGLITVRPE